MFATMFLRLGPGDVWQAVKDKDKGRVEQLMQSDFVPDEYDMTHGGTPLHQAAWDGETVCANVVAVTSKAYCTGGNIIDVEK